MTLPSCAAFSPVSGFASPASADQAVRGPRGDITELSCWPSHRNRRLGAEDCFAGATPAVLIVTSVLAPTFTCRLAMSEGRQPALAGTVIGPSRQASHTPGRLGSGTGSSSCQPRRRNRDRPRQLLRQRADARSPPGADRRNRRPTSRAYLPVPVSPERLPRSRTPLDECCIKVSGIMDGH